MSTEAEAAKALYQQYKGDMDALQSTFNGKNGTYQGFYALIVIVVIIIFIFALWCLLAVLKADGVIYFNDKKSFFPGFIARLFGQIKVWPERCFNPANVDIKCTRITTAIFYVLVLAVFVMPPALILHFGLTAISKPINDTQAEIEKLRSKMDDLRKAYPQLV